jgi:DNA ligase 4
LDDKPIIPAPYAKRREILESLITLRPGYTLLAKRIPVSLQNGASQAEKDLAKAFNSAKEDHEEGLMLKDADAPYNDYRRPWVKLKKDYIDGYGDCLDLLLFSGRWDKDRGRELRGTFLVLQLWHVL